MRATLAEQGVQNRFMREMALLRYAGWRSQAPIKTGRDNEETSNEAHPDRRPALERHSFRSRSARVG
jgi:hypothetical protein